MHPTKEKYINTCTGTEQNALRNNNRCPTEIFTCPRAYQSKDGDSALLNTQGQVQRPQIFSGEGESRGERKSQRDM